MIYINILYNHIDNVLSCPSTELVPHVLPALPIQSQRASTGSPAETVPINQNGQKRVCNLFTDFCCSKILEILRI